MEFIRKFKFALIFTAVYILTIFGFAIIYMGYGDQFYHSTAQYESDVDESYYEIVSELQSIVLDAFHEEDKHHSKYIDNEDGWLLHEDDLIVDRFESDGNRLTIYLSVYITNAGDVLSGENSTGFVQTLTRFNLQYAGMSTFHDDGSIREDRFYYGGVETRDMTSMGYSNFDVYKIFDSEDSKMVHLMLPYDLIEKINAYDMSLNGFPSGIQGNFLRMLYLSMVTITTLGYGDIVPITDTARMLVGIESVLGIIIIGWLATSLFNAFAKIDG